MQVPRENFDKILANCKTKWSTATHKSTHQNQNEIWKNIRWF